jgi:hypothetical protein
MKTKIFTTITFLGIATLTLLFACKKEKLEGGAYSCDPGIQRWASNARLYSQNISRDSLATYGLDSQMAIFRALTSENKLRIIPKRSTMF